MAASIWASFSNYPRDDQVTVCERNGNLITVDSSQAAEKLKLHGYPDIKLTKEIPKSCTVRESAKSAFLPHEQTVWKRALHAWYDQGVTGAMEEVANSRTEAPQWTVTVAGKALACVRWANSLHGSLFPHLSLSNEDMIFKFSRIRQWYSSPVRAFSWHPHITKLAVALHDDSIVVHSATSEIVPTLKCKLQKNVADLAWQPLSSSVLAVACQCCILIWHVEPTSLATRPSASTVQVLQYNGHGPVTRVAWSPDGRILLSASPVDTAMMAWDVPMETCIPLRRVGGGGVTLLEWSPDGSAVFAATPSAVFRVWETGTWSCEKWTGMAGRCQAACWNKDGSVLLLATENEPFIYSVTFTKDQDVMLAGSDVSRPAVLSLDLSETVLTNPDGEEIRVGGLIHDMVWDPTGERLALIFQGDTEPTEDEVRRVVALFRTKTSPVLEFLPCGFVVGGPREVPLHIAFQPVFREGALLSVIWSSGRIGYIPLYFVATAKVEQERFPQQIPVNGQAETFLYSEQRD
ncbi:aladin-like [Liolophura sinensis]|uniref:aladin-like n=1 Tax=Liolophura sinensis TaxID=3198878 RepID=UPI00315900C7